ncbi:MAG: hypothetical protein RIB67_07365 [Miltoncostaeaceae bacterium]
MLMHTHPRTTAMELAEARLGKPLREALLGEFRSLTAAEICRRLDISRSTLERWMGVLGLERRVVIVPIDHGADATPAPSGQAENGSVLT